MSEKEIEWNDSNSSVTAMSRETRKGIKWSPGYKTLMRFLDEGKVEGPILDYGSGRGECAKQLNVDVGEYTIFTYEPYPDTNLGREKETPDFVSAMKIPDESFNMVICDYVLNVVPPRSREPILKKVYSSLKKGGHVVLTFRTQIDINEGWLPYHDGFVRTSSNVFCGQFQAALMLETVTRLAECAPFEFVSAQRKGSFGQVLLRK